MRWLKLAFLFLSAPLFGQQLGFALEQINGQAIVDAGLTAKGVKVGIVDGGFLRADEYTSLQHIFSNGKVAGYKNYVTPDAPPYSGSRALDDIHGTEVWELMAGYHPENKVQYGLATNATFYLAHTDHGGYERRQEEEFAIEAMEWMASEGVKIINLSLGYNYDYTDEDENYTPDQMDGKSTILTRAVDRISNTYGILIIVAAGNDGDHSWRIIGSPADAREALTVGATKFKIWDHMSYSSVGPEWLEYVKPEISCFSSLGTSFSAPIISGLAACLLEKDSTLTGRELKSLIMASGHLSAANNYIGFGVPDAGKALKLLQGDSTSEQTAVQSEGKSMVLELPNPSRYAFIYHKNDWKVLEREILNPEDTSIRIRRREEASSSTVVFEGGSIEIDWIDN